MKCNKCGNELKANDKFCTKCGLAIESNENFKNNNGKKLLIISVILLTIIIVIIIITNSSKKYSTNEDIFKFENETTVEITPKESYGKIVDNYNAQGLKWMIFYSDDDNVYLISQKTVFGDKISEMILNGENNKFDYSLLENDPTNFPAGKKWFSGYINSGYVSSGEYFNTIAILYMLNSNYWKKYVDENYADWAIGGPTLEMFCASYNAVKGTSYEAKPSNTRGYPITIEEKIEKGSLWNIDYTESGVKAGSYRMACPYSDDYGISTLYLHSTEEKIIYTEAFSSTGSVIKKGDGYESMELSSDSCKYRPIVCLKKDVKFKFNSDTNTYSIIYKENKKKDENNNTDNDIVKSEQNKKNFDIYVGKEVTNYNVTAYNGKWEVFYRDEDNIYLISKNIVKEKALVEDVLNRNNLLVTTSVLSDNTKYPSVKKWLSKWMNIGYSTNETNMLATVYMIDSSEWTEYVDENYADWAIGGPTPELLCASLNIGTELIYKVDMADSYKNRIGLLKELKKEDTCGYAFYSSGNTYLPKDTMWYRNESYWLASPSYRKGIDFVDSNGMIIDGDYMDSHGYRPIVCLNSNATLESNGDGTYSITLGNKDTSQNEITGIEKAIQDGMIGKDYVTEGVSESKLKAAFLDGNLQLYYDNWDKCLEDAKKLNIITSDEEYLTMEEELEKYYNEQNFEFLQ